MTLHIKNMVCNHCIAAVKSALVSAGIPYREVGLGYAVIEGELGAELKSVLERKLKELGFELLDDPRSQMVEQIKVAVLEWVRQEGRRPRMSDYLCDRLMRDYSSLSRLFSEVHGMTIERFAILHRIEYAKELLCYNQQTTSEIAYLLGYSSPAHLSAQFKQVTGMTPKEFREQDKKNRISLSEI